ncbi:MAG: PDR/VanB family oxidoreductase [Devosia sp.]
MTEHPVSLRLVQIRLEAQDIASYEFHSADERPLPPFTAGAHIDLAMPGGMVRSYSLVNSPSDGGRYVVAVRREADGKGGSAWMHSTPRVGALLASSTPANDFALDEDAAESIFIAGGIGVTPFMAMARRLNALGKPWRMHYAARSPETAAFVHDLSGLAQTPGAVEWCFSSVAGKRLDLAAIVQAAPVQAHLYCCGPAGMIDAFLQASANRPADRIHTERFGAAAEAATEGGFEVVLKKSGRCFPVLAGKTILDTLLDNAVDVQYACMAGVCGTCQTGVLQGTPDHRDDYLTDEEKQSNKTIMICCSGARTKSLTLDL